MPEPIGWQALAELTPDPLAGPRAIGELAEAPAGPPTAPATTVPPATVRLAAAAAPAAPRPTVPAAPAAPTVPQGEPLSAGTREPVAPQPPQVLIDRIEVITPPASPPAADPFASLAPRRVGASRHGGAG